MNPTIGNMFGKHFFQWHGSALLVSPMRVVRRGSLRAKSFERTVSTIFAS